MDLFYATQNESKIYNMRRRLEGINIQIITPKELSLHLEVDDDVELLIALMANNPESIQFYHSIENASIHDQGIWITI